MSGQGVSPAEELLKPSVEDDHGSNASPAKEGMLKPSAVSGPNDQASGSSLTKQGKKKLLKPSFVSREDDQAFDPSPATEDMRIFLHPDPRGRPYEISDFLQTMRNFGLYHEVNAIGPLLYRKVWLMILQSPNVRRALITSGSMQVKGHYCAIIDPAVKEVWFKVHWVPFHISNASLRRALQEYGTVKKVSCHMWSKQEAVATSTTRHVRMCLKEGLKLKDLPHLWYYKDRLLLIVAPGRRPLCLKCRRLGHFNRHCTAFK
ncbi:hypothetical protein HPB49_024496 [Dermacentor silvarum]|uniref:Uncharacterized protein n=1 Tax=Dermacentor silvarum TaxID=543639 RepID=A0ACB8D1F5_DERSI|nr:hypothetical protein HPB49_024496 [Dermacentor silvarum]